MLMLRCLRILIFFVLLIVFPIVLLALLWWWLKQRDAYPATLMGGEVEAIAPSESSTAIEIPEQALKSPPPDPVPPDGVVTVVETPAVVEPHDASVEADAVAAANEVVAEVEDVAESTEVIAAEVIGGNAAEVRVEADAVVEEVVPDNLKRIEGIGPKVAGLLQQADILTFAQLAATDVETLRDILKAAALPFLNPRTWPEQAALAADEAWEALDKLQDDLKGGRRA